MNFLISDKTHSPPVRLLGYLRGLEDSFGEQAADICNRDATDTTNTGMTPKQCLRKKESSIKHRVRQLCLTELVKSWGNMPLKTSEVRLNPQLYHDEVSNMRKKYRVIETMKSLFWFRQCMYVLINLLEVETTFSFGQIVSFSDALFVVDIATTCMALQLRDNVGRKNYAYQTKGL